MAEYKPLPHVPKAPDILEAEVHALWIVIAAMFQLLKDDKSDKGHLAARLKLLIENKDKQQDRLSEKGLAHYTEVLQDLRDVLDPPFQ